MRRGLHAALGALLLFLSGCGSGGKLNDLPTPELSGAIAEAKKGAVEARAAQDAKQSESAAARAEEALAILKEREDANEETLAQATADAGDARTEADFAAEEEHLRGVTSGLKAQAYRAGRRVALSAALEGLALAAEHAAKAQASGASAGPGVDQAAGLAASFAGLLNLTPGGMNSPEDAELVAPLLRYFKENDPPRMKLFLALCFLVVAQDDFAIMELANVPADPLKAEERILYHILYAAAANLQGCPRTCAQSISDALGGDGTVEVDTRAQGCLHIFAAAAYLQFKDYRRADLEIVRSLKVWPDNPAMAYVTGQRLSEEGKWEEAADSLEKAAETEEEKWLAEYITKRARNLRDSKGAAEPLFYDPAIKRKFMIWQLAKLAKNSPPARKAAEWVDCARAFGKELMAKLPDYEKTTDASEEE